MDLTTTLLIISGILILTIGYFVGKQIGYLEAQRNMHTIIKKEREDATKRSRAVLSGQMSEQIAPYLPDFPYSPTEVRFIGKPVDFIVFKGMDEKNIDEVIFLEMKTGKSTLNSQEKKLKETIQNKKVSWKEYRLD